MTDLSIKAVQKTFKRRSTARKDLEKVLKPYESAQTEAKKKPTRESLLYLTKCHKDVGAVIKAVTTKYAKKYPGKGKTAKKRQAAIGDLERAWVKERKDIKRLVKTHLKTKKGKPKNFEWNKTLEYKSKGFVLFEGCKYGGKFHIELLLPPDSPPAMVDRLYHHLFTNFTHEEKRFKTWVENHEKELNYKCDKMTKKGKLDAEVIAKTIRKELKKSVDERIEKIDKALKDSVNEFFLKNAEAKALAKQFKIKTKTRLKRDLVLGNISNMVAGITGGVAGGIQGGTAGATAGAATGPFALIAAPLFAAAGGIFYGLKGITSSLVTGIKGSIETLAKYKRVEADYRKKLVLLLEEAKSHLHAYQDIADDGGAGKNVKKNWSKWSNAFLATTQKLSKAVEQHQGAFAVMLQESDKLSKELDTYLKKAEPREKELAGLEKTLAKAQKRAAKMQIKAKTKKEQKHAKKELKDLKKLNKDIKWWNKQLDKGLRKPINKLFNQIYRMNERAQTVQKLDSRFKGIEAEARSMVKELGKEKAKVLGPKSARNIDAMVNFMHTLSPFTNSFFATSKEIVAGGINITKAVVDK